MKLQVLGTIVIGALLLAGPVQAKNFPIPAAKPLVTIDAPDSWKTDTSETEGITTTSPDGALYVVAGTADASDMAILDETVQSVASGGVKLDESSKRATHSEGDINGSHAKISSLFYKAQNEVGLPAITVTSYAFDQRPDQVFLFVVIVGLNKTPADDDAVTAMIKSIHFIP